LPPAHNNENHATLLITYFGQIGALIRAGYLRMTKHFGKLLVAVLACAYVVFATVTTDYSHSADFGKYKTYSWIQVSVQDPLWEDRVTRTIDAELTAKGWTRVPAGGDAAVAAYGSTHSEKTLQTWYTGFGGGWRWHGFGDGFATTTVERTPVGTLMVDIFDSSNQKLIWR
jgi:hypothetical protein